MKTTLRLFSSLISAVLWTFASGCSKQQDSGPAGRTTAPPQSSVSEATTATLKDAEAKARSAAEQAAAAQRETEARARAEAERLQAAAKEQAEAARKAAADAQAQVAATAAKVASLIDTAKKLTSENKWAEALKILNDLAAAKLTPQQQAVVDSLKEQANKELKAAAAKKATDEAAKAVGGLLKPKN